LIKRKWYTKKPTFEVIGNIPGLEVRGDVYLYTPMAREPIVDINPPESGLVYRYSKQKYVNKFFETGELQLNFVKSYSDTSDHIRWDDQEGSMEFDMPESGKFVGDDGIAIKITNDNPDVVRDGPPRIKGQGNGLVLCTSLKKSDELQKKFGGAVFEINDIPNFTKSLESEIEKQHPIHDIVTDKITYTDDWLPPNLFGPRGIIFQKPKSYSDEEEFRFYFSPEKAVHFPVKIHCLDAIQYCSK